MELRSPDTACNPYLAFALLIYAGLEGIEQKKKLAPPCNENLFEAQDYADQNGIRRLPGSLAEALELAEGSEFIRRALPERVVSRYLQAKREEWECYQRAEDKEAYDLKHAFLFE